MKAGVVVFTFDLEIGGFEIKKLEKDLVSAGGELKNVEIAHYYFFRKIWLLKKRKVRGKPLKRFYFGYKDN